jgi:hypothetical protein
MEMPLPLAIQALLAQIAVPALQHRQQQMALLFFVQGGGFGHGGKQNENFLGNRPLLQRISLPPGRPAGCFNSFGLAG